MEVILQADQRIYEEYHGKVYSYILGKVSDPDAAEDLCSDVFLKVYEKFALYDLEKASLSTWIFTVARNTLADYFRTRRVFSEIPGELESDENVEAEVCNAEMLGLLADGLERLPERERNLIILHYYSGLTLKDIAVRFGISYGYAKILHSRALNGLKKFLE